LFDGKFGNPAPSPKGGRSPQFSARVYRDQTAAWIKMSLGTEVGLGPDDIVLYADPAPLPKKRAEPPPQFSAHVYCGQTAGWIEMALGVDVGLGPGHIVLDGDPAPPAKKAQPPIFGLCLLWSNGWMWMDEAATWFKSRPQPRLHCFRRGPISPRKGHSSTPSFRPMSIVATVAYLSYR